MTEYEQKANDRLDKLSQEQLTAVLWYLIGYYYDNDQFYKDVLMAVDRLEGLGWEAE